MLKSTDIVRAVTRAAVGATVTLLILACGGGGEKPAANESAAATPPATPAPGGGGAMPGPAPGQPPTGATAAMVAMGDSIFHGLVAAGQCQTCHGPDAKGTPLAPSLLDGKWLTGNGTYEFIQNRVTTGMPQPTPPYAAPMLPMGGAQLSPEQIKAVAAYVYSISRGKTGS